jgi:peptidoglycan/LPS O-acetylase OafA/YrhL
MSESKKVTKKHFAQLDSLRAFAVAGVAWSHWMPNYTFGLPCSAGVQLFFVLSGFLITCILLQARSGKDLNKSNSTTSGILKAFYSRRFLRIFPLYYLVLLIVVILNLPGARVSFLWHFGYASNYYYFLLNAWNGPTSHFWTLAVEEQFYLFWPLVVLLVSRRYLLPTFVGFVLLGVAYRLVGDIWFTNWLMWDITLFGNFDSLCLGGILAYFHQTQSQAFSNKDVSEEESLRLKLQFCLILVLRYF